MTPIEGSPELVLLSGKNSSTRQAREASQRPGRPLWTPRLGHSVHQGLAHCTPRPGPLCLKARPTGSQGKAHCVSRQGPLYTKAWPTVHQGMAHCTQRHGPLYTRAVPIPSTGTPYPVPGTSTPYPPLPGTPPPHPVPHRTQCHCRTCHTARPASQNGSFLRTRAKSGWS